MTDSHLWVIIPAAGVGRRMQSEVPKQYLPLNGATVLERTLQIFLLHPQVRRVYVVLHANDSDWTQLGCAEHPLIETVTGGAERIHSVMQALHALQDVAASNDWVMVHDAVRPCLTLGQLNNLLQTIADHPVGGALAVPVHDTLMQGDHWQRVVTPVPRDNVWQVQTPQVFRYAKLLAALNKVMADGKMVTDDASALHYVGEEVLLIAGNRANIKITWPEDLLLAQKILQE